MDWYEVLSYSVDAKGAMRIDGGMEKKVLECVTCEDSGYENYSKDRETQLSM
jgi:hypothetical protein